MQALINIRQADIGIDLKGIGKIFDKSWDYIVFNSFPFQLIDEGFFYLCRVLFHSLSNPLEKNGLPSAVLSGEIHAHPRSPYLTAATESLFEYNLLRLLAISWFNIVY
jgi:hypothetical protein